MDKLTEITNRVNNRVQELEAWIKQNHYTYTTSYTDGLHNAKEEELRELWAIQRILERKT